MEEFVCVICNKKITGQYGNDPYPVKKNGKCCDNCNQMIVIPERLIKMRTDGKY